MSLLKSLATDNTINNETDNVGGGSFVLDSGVYECTIDTAFITKATSGALGLELTLKTSDDKTIKQTLWMTSGTAKGGKNYYEKDGEKHYLPGFLHANALTLLTVGKEISDLDTETKVIKKYSSEAKAEVPTKVDMIMDILGKEIKIGLIKQKVDKTKKNDATGAYEPTGEFKEENDIDKMFRARDNMTTAEIRAGAEEATFIDTWSKKWTGKLKDKSKGVSGNTGTAGAPKPAATTGTKKPTTSLFA